MHPLFSICAAVIAIVDLVDVRSQLLTGSMNAIDAAGLLPKVLSHLTSPLDLISVGTVCKPWLRATSDLTPHKLVFGRQDQLDPLCAGMVQWFQRQLKHNNLNQLAEFELYIFAYQAFTEDVRWERPDTDMYTLLHTVFAGLMAVLGLTKLQSCYLHGIEWLPDTLMTLPTSLKSLTLCPDFPEGREIMAVDFARFQNLELLSVQAECKNCFAFVVNASLPSLATLELHSGTLLLAPHLRSLAGQLPSLCCLVTDVVLDSKSHCQGVHEILQVVPMLTLKFADSFEPAPKANFVVSKSSQVKQLTVYPESGQDVQVHVHCLGVHVQFVCTAYNDYCTSGCSVVVHDL